MINVLIVDDEQIEREGLKLFLKDRPNIHIVGEASNGRQAIEKALETQPDLMMMDIKMPGVDGVQAVKEIKQQLPETEFIMVSAFDTFEYAREVMRYGVKEYLLKPTTKEDVLTALDRIVGEIEQAREEKNDQYKLQQRLEQISSFVQTESILYLLMDHIQDYEWMEWNEWLRTEQEGYAVVFSFHQQGKEIRKTEKQQWHARIKKEIGLQLPKSTVGPFIGHHLPILMLTENENGMTKQEREQVVIQLLHKVKQAVQPAKVKTGVGGIYRLHFFSTSYREALLALDIIYDHKQASYYFYDKNVKIRADEQLPIERENKLIEAIKSGDGEKALQAFDHYVQAILRCSKHPLHDMRKYLQQLFIILGRLLNEMGLHWETAQDFARFSTVHQVTEHGKSEILHIVRTLQEWRTTDEQSLMLLARDYVHDHFREPLTLDDLAKHIGLSPYYVSKLFKERFDLTFSEYVTQLRVEHAKQLLSLTQKSLKEITYEIGYKDPNYFSRVFKKLTGKSPSDYRKSINGLGPKEDTLNGE
ncbi:response regulator transcription factor [Halalkalibacterium halodurans]|uniref:Two-component response regulator n=1 Tax=Halalkalibacterium halodurans (strain ATCC BAA-125 / DSM 18197 / FERM 7344 / JCM 9153 / C-125) TaxID=272558 RepID=Q9K690_HALH5|nr:response regulator transcription factor [Halalkalibacterium halodurans]MED4079551.1 response regulator transcription factor [Halalkalibacterium halodurans]MED4084172.1 response regulator transcription factor [Halalkalibacterium halodurans]MED4104650.1 response regulator transcription factor [Halalkalibacterium halodurans]MED4108378.1 response regulator transcription factor [Halalkalibacterium halodurans]MED4147399.1 response regulator transcription factor [Halalkalibacterium halodurans]